MRIRHVAVLRSAERGHVVCETPDKEFMKLVQNERMGNHFQNCCFVTKSFVVEILCFSDEVFRPSELATQDGVVVIHIRANDTAINVGVPVLLLANPAASAVNFFVPNRGSDGSW
jgi:hypothetical protein